MEMIHLNQNNTIKLGMSFFLLVLISICGNGKTGLGKLLNRMDNDLNKSKINFSFDVFDENNKKTNIDLSNMYVFIEGENGDKYIFDLFFNNNKEIDKMYDYNYDNLHNIISQKYNIYVAKYIGKDISFDKTKSFNEIRKDFIKLYDGYNIDGEYTLVFPNNITISDNNKLNLNIVAQRINGNKYDINDLNNDINPYLKYNIYTKYYSQLVKNKYTVCADTIINLKTTLGSNNYINSVFSTYYINNDLYSKSEYLTSLINNNPDNYNELINEILVNNIKNITTNNSNNLLENKIDFNTTFNKLDIISNKLLNSISSDEIKFYYVTIDENNNKLFDYNSNNSNYVVVNVDCSNKELIEFNDNSSRKVIYNFYKIVDGKKVPYDGEIFVKNINNSILLAPSAFIHNSNNISSNIISYEYIQE